MKSSIRKLFETEFGLDVDKMDFNKPYNVEEARIGIKSFDEDTGKPTLALVTAAIKKACKNPIRLKIKGRDDWEKPVDGKHMYGIYKHDDGHVDYTYAEDLSIGNKVLTVNGLEEIENIEKTKLDYVLDIQTDAENYYTNGILSHNSVMSHLPSQTGGTAVKFFASTRNRITKIDQLKDNSGNDAGIQIRVRNYKNKTGIPWRDAVMNLYFDRGFDSDAEYFDFLSEFGLITKGNGGVYSADFWNESTGVPTGKIRGAANALAWFQDPTHRDIYEGLKVKVNEKLMSKNELDADSVNPEINEMEEVSKEKNIPTSKLAEEALNASKEEEALEKEVMSSTEETPPDLGL